MAKQYRSISVRELREEFPKVREGLSQGVQFVLIYRSKPIGELRPITSSSEAVSKSLSFFANPPKSLRFRSKQSAVTLIRRERDR